MEFPISIEQSDGKFVVSVLGSPELRAVHATRDGAIAALKVVISQRVAAGSIASIAVPLGGWMALFGKYRDDPSLQEICDQAYRERDAQPKE